MSDGGEKQKPLKSRPTGDLATGQEEAVKEAVRTTRYEQTLADSHFSFNNILFMRNMQNPCGQKLDLQVALARGRLPNTQIRVPCAGA